MSTYLFKFASIFLGVIPKRLNMALTLESRFLAPLDSPGNFRRLLLMKVYHQEVGRKLEFSYKVVRIGKRACNCKRR